MSISLYPLLQDVVARLESERVHSSASSAALIASTDAALATLAAAILEAERNAAHVAETLRGLAEGAST